MKLTLVQPAVGRRPGSSYLKTWQMEPLQLAALAALTPDDVEVSLQDDRVERIDFDAPADLVAISVETYTALRSYQIASEYRRRGVPVVLGGFHPTLVPEEAMIHAESIVVGEAEGRWAEVIDDHRSGTLKRVYRTEGGSSKHLTKPDRSIFEGKSYLPIGLLESSRGCNHRCDFCAITAFYGGKVAPFDVEDVARQMWELAPSKKFLFVVDDNFGADRDRAKELCRLLARNPVPWVGQCSMDALRDEELVALMVLSGCIGVLVGFETLDDGNLGEMNKGFNRIADYDSTMKMVANKGLCIYGTFIFGYDGDTENHFETAVSFAREHAMYLAAFNHLVPFPGTPVYDRLRAQNRLFEESWWLDPQYGFNQVTFRPKLMSADQLRRKCLESRREFYSWRSIVGRGLRQPSRGRLSRAVEFFLINALQRREVGDRDGFPLGDQGWKGNLRSSARDAA